MKKIGGLKFNRSTWEQEYEPVRYVEFHCKPSEWSKLSNGKFYLVRDFIRSLNSTSFKFQNITVMDVIDLAVKAIISDRYQVRVLEKTRYDHLSNRIRGKWEVTIPNVPKCPPYPAYVGWIYDSNGRRWAPELGDIVYDFDNCGKRIISAVVGVCDAIFKLAESTKKRYYDKYVSGEYEVDVYLSELEKLKL